MKTDGRTDLNVNNNVGTTTVSVAHSTEGERRYQAHLYFDGHAGGLPSNVVSVTWAAKP